MNENIRYLQKIKKRYLTLLENGYNILDAGDMIIEEFNHMQGYDKDECYINIIYKGNYLLNLSSKTIYKEIKNINNECINCDQLTETYSICSNCLNKIIKENKSV